LPEIRVRTEVAAPLETVYRLAKEIERLPEFDENLESVRVVERDGHRVVSEWVGVVRELGQRIRWTEEDVWDDAAYMCRFAMTKGDFDAYEGSWSFQADGESRTIVDLAFSYEYDVPLIGPLIKGLLHKKTQASAEGIMDAVKQLAEAEGAAS
jgi:ribosome-associated toxin RatA of RatAB toxin-antitoxin module